jgi:hypothetical protein
MSRSLADLVGEALAEIQEIQPAEAGGLLELPDRDGWEFLDVREAD